MPETETVETIAAEILERWGWKFGYWNLHIGGYAYYMNKQLHQIRCSEKHDKPLDAARAAREFWQEQERENPLLKEAVEIIREYRAHQPYPKYCAEKLDIQANAFLARIKEG